MGRSHNGSELIPDSGRTVTSRRPPDNAFTRFYNLLANMGLVIRDDPPRVIDMTAREWGDPVDGLELSIRELPRDESGKVTGLSVVMRNTGSEAKRLNIPPWSYFYKVDGLEFTPFGQQFARAEAKGPNVDVPLGSGDAIESDLPLSTIYRIRDPGEYRVQVSCTLPGGKELRSNPLMVRTK
jgi:hypothetical protein